VARAAFSRIGDRPMVAWVDDLLAGGPATSPAAVDVGEPAGTAAEERAGRAS
jgi:hypothetical protein